MGYRPSSCLAGQGPGIQRRRQAAFHRAQGPGGEAGRRGRVHPKWVAYCKRWGKKPGHKVNHALPSVFYPHGVTEHSKTGPAGLGIGLPATAGPKVALKTGTAMVPGHASQAATPKGAAE